MVLSLTIGIAFVSCGDDEPDYEWNYNDDIDDNNENKDVSLSISPSSTEFEADGGSKTIQIQSNGSWNINSSNVPYWLTISPMSGSGSQSITLRASTNSDTSTRSSSILVTSSKGSSSTKKSISVTQKGKNSTNSSVPSAPTGLTATQAGPKAYAYIALSWDFKYDSNIDHYVIYRSTSQYGSYSKIGTSKSTSYSDENISNGKTYYYKVTAANNSNKESGYSNIVSVTVNTTIVEAPGIKTCTVKTGTNQITISWTYASSSGYSAPDQVRLISEDPTWTGLSDVFSWTSASSKKSHTVKASDLIYNGNSKNEYTLYLEVKNSGGNGKGAKIVWNWMTNTGYVSGSLCGYTSF